uniref:Uncharacterized protein n=1 Tax=Anopheles albimanus TaxID=7167 RepID=A0A182FWY1_ANOAL
EGKKTKKGPVGRWTVRPSYTVCADELYSKAEMQTVVTTQTPLAPAFSKPALKLCECYYLI